MRYGVILLVFFILFLAFLSFNASLYWFLIPITGIQIAYIVDQLLPFAIVLSISFFLIKRQKIVFDFLKSHYLLLSLLTLIAFFVHKEILGFYFYSEGPHTVLFNTMENPNVFIYGLRGYPFAMYVASFLLFWTNAWAFNLVTIILYILVTLSFYVLLYALINKKFISFVGTIFFVTIPSYLTMFIWQHDAPGMIVGLLSGIFCVLFLLYYQKEKNIGMYLLSLLFYIAAIKIGFGRTVGFITLPLFLLFFPIYDVKINLKKSILLSFPYIATFLLYLLIVFFIPDNVFGKIIAGQTSKIAPRSAPLYFNNYFYTLSTWVAYLFLPNQLAILIYKSLAPYASSSITVFVGMLSSFALVVISGISFFHFGKKEARLLILSVVWIFSNIFYLPILVFDYHNLSIIDRDFTSINPGSAPGSKYVFYASMGLCIMIAVFTLLARKKSKRVFHIWITFLVILIIYYATLSRAYYSSVLAEMPSVREIPDKVFSMVPKNGEKKLLFSPNPILSALDSPGPEWPNSFYSDGELFYTHDRSLVEQFIKEGKYKKENVYVFYNNPPTLAFADVSKVAREELFSINKSKNTETILKNPEQITSKLSPSGLNNVNYQYVLERGVFISPDLSYRFVLPKTIRLMIQKNTQQSQFPYLDASFIDQNNKKIMFPLSIWSYTNNPPLIVKKDEVFDFLRVPSFDNSFIHVVSQEDKINIADILKERESIRLGIMVEVSQMDENPKLRKESLIDGLFLDFPLRDGEFYYNAKTNDSTKITLTFSHIISLGRILLNVPPGAEANVPVNIKVYSLQNQRQLIGVLQNASLPLWSPNKGYQYLIPVEQVPTDRIEIDVEKTAGAPLMLDEITLDPPSALSYSPEKIYELSRFSFHYVDNEILLKKLQMIQEFNSLTAFYACGEENDWSMQKKGTDEMPNMWKVFDISMDATKENEELTFPVDCYGSVLRKVIIVGSPYLSNIVINKMDLE